MLESLVPANNARRRSARKWRPLLDYAQAHDYQVSPHPIYQDDGYSGASLDRPALDRLRDGWRPANWRPS
jgi:hypothetical protein